MAGGQGRLKGLKALCEGCQRTWHTGFCQKCVDRMRAPERFGGGENWNDSQLVSFRPLGCTLFVHDAKGSTVARLPGCTQRKTPARRYPCTDK